MKFTSPFVGILALILLIAVPVGGSPTLQVGSYANYNLSATISFPPPICQSAPTSGIDTLIAVCPDIAVIPPTINVTGALGWTTTGLNTTTAALNVTHDITVSADGLMVPTIHKTGSFNESVNLASRIIGIMPLLRTELDDAFQTDQTMMASSLPPGVDPSSAMSTIESTIREPPSVYTMWWVNGPLSVNQTVRVLVLPTNVTGSTSVDLGALGTRTAWSLVFNLTKPISLSSLSPTSTAWTSGNLGVLFTFNYDQKSDLLLSATASIHVGFEEETIVQPTQCDTSTGTTLIWCPASTSSTSSVTMIRSYGFNINASLTLASTNLNLDQRMNPPETPASDTTTNSGSNSGTGPGSGMGTSQSSGPGTNDGAGSTGSSPGSTPQSAAALQSSMSPWTYWVLALVAVAIVLVGLVFARKRRSSQSPTATTSISD